MTLFQAIILGVVQGITEFFPISSSGHLVIFQQLFGMKEPHLPFDITLHFGTLLAIIIFFRKDIANLFTRDRRLIRFLFIASIPTFIIGFLFKDIVESFFARPKVVGYMLILAGAWFIAATLCTRFMSKRQGKLGALNSILIGTAQGIAIMPGISRSGATIATGMMTGLTPELSLRFSFLLAIPAILGATMVKLPQIGQSVSGDTAYCFLAGGISSMLTGLAAVSILLRVVRSNLFYVFGIYCIVAGILTSIMCR